jgi:hypothetical protein
LKKQKGALRQQDRQGDNIGGLDDGPVGGLKVEQIQKLNGKTAKSARAPRVEDETPESGTHDENGAIGTATNGDSRARQRAIGRRFEL